MRTFHFVCLTLSLIDSSSKDDTLPLWSQQQKQMLLKKYNQKQREQLSAKFADHSANFAESSANFAEKYLLNIKSLNFQQILLKKSFLLNAEE